MLIKQILSRIKTLYEKLKPHFHKGVHHGSHHVQVAFAGLAGLYWNLSPTNRYRVRLAAFAFAILSLGIVLGRVTNVNRIVKIEASDKALKVERAAFLSLSFLVSNSTQRFISFRLLKKFKSQSILRFLDALLLMRKNLKSYQRVHLVG